MNLVSQAQPFLLPTKHNRETVNKQSTNTQAQWLLNAQFEEKHTLSSTAVYVDPVSFLPFLNATFLQGTFLSPGDIFTIRSNFSTH